jgi:hypothetical protein
LGPGGGVDLLALLQDRPVLAAVSLSWGDELQGAVQMLLVVPVREALNPLTGLLDALEGLGGEVRAST